MKRRQRCCATRSRNRCSGGWPNTSSWYRRVWAALLDEALADSLGAAHPGTRFRLHANVQVLPMRRLADLSGFALHADWFAQAARISQRLEAPAYTAHAGRRCEADLPACWTTRAAAPTCSAARSA